MMTSFNTLFNRMFQEKSRAVYLIYLIQLFASLCFTILAIFSSNSNLSNVVIYDEKANINIVIIFLLLFAGMVIMTSFLANFAYWIVSSVKNEKINRSQTWRLTPISDTKFLLSNFGTAFLSYIWLVILEVLTTVIAFLPMLSNSEVRSAFGKLNYRLDAQDWWTLLGVLVMVILLGYAWYATVSLINLSSHSVMDFLPSGSSKFIMFIIRVVIIIAVIWLLAYAVSTLDNAIDNIWINGSNDLSMGLVLIEFLVFDVIVTLLDILLLNKFVEAKHN